MDAALLPANGGRISAIDFNGERAWCKRAVHGHSRWRYRALDTLAETLDLRLVRAVYNPGGIAALQTERRRLDGLRDAGVPVPDILAEGEDWHVLSDSGISLREALRRSPAMRSPLASLAVGALRAVHARGQYLSQAFDRNLCVQDGEIRFIDFEDDPGSVFELPEAQARDWLLLLSSLAQHFENDTAALKGLCRQVTGNIDDVVASLLMHDARRLCRILRFIPGSGQLRELRRLKLFADCLSGLSR